MLASCPCDLLMDGEEEVVEGSILLRGVLALRACWLVWYRGPAGSGTGGTEAPGLSFSQSPSGGVSKAFSNGYMEHIGYTARSCHFCLRCGKVPRDNRLGFQLHTDGACLGPNAPLTATVAVAVGALLHTGAEFPFTPCRRFCRPWWPDVKRWSLCWAQGVLCGLPNGGPWRPVTRALAGTGSAGKRGLRRTP